MSIQGDSGVLQFTIKNNHRWTCR